MTNWRKPEMKIKFFSAFFFAATISIFAQEAPFQNFITARGDLLMDGDRPFRFISFNIPNLLLVEDNYPFAQTNAWRLPDQFEITDALVTVRQMGGTVVRTYSITVMRGDNPPAQASQVLAPGKFNEKAFVVLDRALQTANEQGVRLVIPLMNNWPWMGGRAEYATFRGKGKNDFWTDPQLIADFKETIKHVLTRTNTLTGVRYCDDKAVLCWETGNELDSPAAWTRDIAAYIKSLDHNHLVMDGNTSGMRSGSLEIPDVDIVTTHHYSGGRGGMAQTIRNNAAQAKGKKIYVVGEFGFVSTAQMADALQAIRDSSAAGGLLWSLRFHDRDGGFYWHSEPAGGNVFKAFHWPGSSVADEYDEITLMALVRSNAFAIRGLPVPEIPIPAPPKLLPITDAGAISWQGSVGATTYTVESAPQAGGPWTIAGTNVDESAAQYFPQFSDESAPKGKWFYRVRAKNNSGISEPSNIVGPVKVAQVTFVDDLADLKKASAVQGALTTTLRDSRKAKEDAQRAAGSAGDALIYRLPNRVEGFRVFAFFPSDVADLKFLISADGKNFRDVTAAKENYYAGAGDYDYWKPVLYHAEKTGVNGKFLKIELTGETQIGRVEIIHAPGKN
jgi:mannan endo-1,4-beta-mannosidase